MVERGQPGGGQLLERRHVRSDRGQQQGLGQPHLGAEAAGQLGRIAGQIGWGQTVLGQQPGQQLLPVQGTRRTEQPGELRIQRLLALHHMVIAIADRDDVVDGEAVAPVDEHLLHDLERGPFPLHGTGQ